MILQSPENWTAFRDQSAEFTCETDGSTSGWNTNGSLWQTLPPDMEVDIKITRSTTFEDSSVETLTIPARAEYNQGLIEPLKVARGHATHTDGEIQHVTKFKYT